MSRITSYKIGRETIDNVGQYWVTFRYRFNDGSTHEHGPVQVDSRDDALVKCSDARYLIDSCHRKQHSDAPPRRLNTSEERAIAESEEMEG